MTSDIVWKINRLLNQPWPYSDIERIAIKTLLSQLALAKRVQREGQL